MKIEYQETTSDLQTRINIHSQFGARNIDEWMLEVIKPTSGMTILDVGCGAGKQCFSYYDYLHGKASITGGDVNKDMLAQARQTAREKNANLKFIDLDFNQPFPLPSEHFDFASCCFAISYAEDIPFTIREMHRVLRPGGRLFTSGPMPANKQLFYDVIREATGKEIPPMPGSSRYSTQIYAAIQSTFTNVETHIFENPLAFDSVEPFVAYTRASLAEDRKLWNSFFQTKDDFEHIMEQIQVVAARRLAAEGKLVMTKVVGGFIATK
jgi:ubiquinone/menaquinone biosynthesis C-methylase UbiE